MAIRIGRNPVMERLKAQAPIDRLYVEEGAAKGSMGQIFAMAKEQRVPIFTVPQQKLDELAEGGRHQGVVAMVSDFVYSDLDRILERAKERHEAPKVILLAGIEDPHNLGAIIRTAECAGFHGVIIPERRSATITETVARTSAGAVEFMPVVRVTNLVMAIESLKKEGLWIYGADMDGESSPYETDLKGPVGLVIGGENKGLGPKIRAHCDVILSLPMKGRINSLNASNAAAILIYEVLRQEGS